MNYNTFFFTMLSMWLIMGCNKGAFDKESFQLVENGLPKATIIVSSKPSPSARLAGLELQHHVKLITGIILPIVDDTQKTEGNRIFIGDTKFTNQRGIKGGNYEPQEYEILFFDDSALVLYGKDDYLPVDNFQEKGRSILGISLPDLRSKIDYHKAVYENESESKEITLPGIYDNQGSLYATYDFLENALGVRWYGPADFNIVYGKSENLAVKRENKRRSPAMKYRDGTGLGGPIISVQYGKANKDAEELFHRRMRKGGERWGANHSFSSYQDRFLQKNPEEEELFQGKHEEFFAKGRKGGGHQRQFCYTNQGLIDQVVQDARDYFDGKGVKGRQIAMGDYFAVLPLDNNAWCLCDDCQAALAKEKNQFNQDHFSSGTASDYLFNFINEVGKGVKLTHPDKKIATLAYHVYSYYPDSVNLESNISVSPCLHNRHYMSPELKEHELSWYKDWVENSMAPVYLWNYSTFPTERGNFGFGGVNGVEPWKVFPGFSAHAQAELIKMYHEDRIRGVFLCGVGEQLDYYLAMKHYDDPQMDVDKVMDDFFNLYFGGAAVPMRQFYTKIESVYNDFSLYPERVKGEKHFHQDEEIAWKYLGTKEVMNELGSCISEAREKAETALEKKRVESWVVGVWNYMVTGRQQYLDKIKSLDT